jgi:maltokinase
VIDAKSLRTLIPSYLARQRWFAGDKPPSSVEVVVQEELRMPWPALELVIVEADGRRYQLLVGARPAGEEPEFLQGSDYAVLGDVRTAKGKALAYDGLQDAELALALLSEVSHGDERAEWVRPVTAEQSNTSLVFEDRLILKVFRRLHAGGPNPDVEVSLALDDVGFNHIAPPLAVWRRDEDDLAILQPFLAGGTEGWALALTSIRDLYAARVEPAAAGGDFASEAERLGEMTGRMHAALAEAFGTEPGDPGAWAAAMREQLDRVAAKSPWRAGVTAAISGLGKLADAGPAIRVHGDYHLGQVMRVETGWFVLDFEGEPSRPLEERRRTSSPLRDVAGILRSFHYATQVVLQERDEAEREELAVLAAAWEDRNRAAFLRGYQEAKGVDDLLPEDPRAFITVLTAYELDKAVYEVGYERDHRPDWIAIPLAAIRRSVGRE